MKGIALHSLASHTRLVSGDIITMGTDDPVERLLPDFDLLEMQWALHRVAALAATEEADDDDSDDSDSDDGGWRWR